MRGSSIDGKVHSRRVDVRRVLAIEMLGVTRFDLVIDLLPFSASIFLFEGEICDFGQDEPAKCCTK